jgi:hypothetical protein
MNQFYGNFFHDSASHYEVESAKGEARRGDTNVKAGIDKLSREVEKLKLVTRALCELLSENSSVPVEAIFDRIQEIELRDGQLNGKYVEGVSKCSACNRPGKISRGNCMYCGEKMNTDDPLGTVI